MKTNPFCFCLLGIALLLGFNAGAQAIVQIASDSGVSFFVKSDGSLWQGDFAHALATHNEKMKLIMEELKSNPHSGDAFEKFREEGQHITSANFEPVDLIVSNGVTAVAMNGQHDTFFIKDDGSLWAMGNNDSSHLGDGTFETPAHPIQIVSSGVKAVACGEDFTIFLKDNGSVWGFGWSGDGALGIENESVMTPKKIIDGGVVAIAAGYLHSLFIKSDGSLWGMGNNGYGQLGLGTNLNHTLSCIQIVASNVVSMSAAHYQSFFIKSDGSLWAMGLNQFGALGDCTIDWQYRPKQIVSDNVVAVTAGESGTLFLKNDGSLWAMGISWGTDYGEGVEFGVNSDAKCPTQIFAPNKSATVAGYYYNAQLKTYANIWAGKFNNTPANLDSASSKTALVSSSASLPGYNLITVELLKNGDVRLTYSGDAGVNYALERSSSLSQPDWISLVTNAAPVGGVLVMTNTPDTSKNNFWRIRTVH